RVRSSLGAVETPRGCAPSLDAEVMDRASVDNRRKLWTAEENCGQRLAVNAITCIGCSTLGSKAALKEATDAEAGRSDEGLDNPMRRVRHGGRGHCGRLEGVPGRWL